MSSDQQYPFFPNMVGNVFQCLLLLPVNLQTDSENYGQVNGLLLGYGVLVLVVYNLLVTRHLSKGLPHPIILPEKEQICLIFSLFACIFVTNLIVLANNIQCTRGMFRQTMEKLKSFDEEFATKPLQISTGLAAYIYIVFIIYHSLSSFCFVLTTALNPNGSDFLLFNIFMAVESMCVFSTCKLFLILVHQVKSRYCLLNETLKRLQESKKPLEVKFLQSISGYIHCYDVSVVHKTKRLHQLLGEMAKMINSSYKIQLLTSLIFVIKIAALFPAIFLFVLNNQDIYTYLGLNEVISIFIGAGILLGLIINYTNTLTSNAKRTSKLVIALLNSDLSRFWHQELNSLLLQLPHQVHKFTLFDLIDFRPDYLISLISLMSVYCFIFAV